MDDILPYVRHHLTGGRTPSLESTVLLTAVGPTGFPVLSKSFRLIVQFMCQHILVTPVGN
jgi:hypothetical protein